jgi:hypothetical protein
MFFLQGQTGEPWEYFKKALLFQHSGSIEWKRDLT